MLIYCVINWKRKLHQTSNVNSINNHAVSFKNSISDNATCNFLPLYIKTDEESESKLSHNLILKKFSSKKVCNTDRIDTKTTSLTLNPQQPSTSKQAYSSDEFKLKDKSFAKTSESQHCSQLQAQFKIVTELNYGESLQDSNIKTLSLHNKESEAVHSSLCSDESFYDHQYENDDNLKYLKDKINIYEPLILNKKTHTNDCQSVSSSTIYY